MAREHDDDMAAEVSEGAGGEADHYAEVAEDLDEREAAAERDRLREMQHNLAEAEGDGQDG
jgi:hypothetical protein